MASRIMKIVLNSMRSTDGRDGGGGGGRGLIDASKDSTC